MQWVHHVENPACCCGSRAFHSQKRPITSEDGMVSLDICGERRSTTVPPRVPSVRSMQYVRAPWQPCAQQDAAYVRFWAFVCTPVAHFYLVHGSGGAPPVHATLRSIKYFRGCAALRGSSRHTGAPSWRIPAVGCVYCARDWQGHPNPRRRGTLTSRAGKRSPI